MIIECPVIHALIGLSVNIADVLSMQTILTIRRCTGIARRPQCPPADPKSSRDGVLRADCVPPVHQSTS